MTAPASSRQRRWLVVGTVVWAALLLALGVYGAGHDRASVRDQRAVTQALPVVDRVAGELFAAVGPDGIEELPPLRVSAACRVTLVRDGVRVDRDVLVHLRPGAGPALLDQVRAALPAAYRAGVWHRPDGAEHTLVADAGDFVAVRGTIEDDGALVRLRASTGCRPTDGATITAPLGGTSPDLTRLATALGVANLKPATSAQAFCPGGGVARTLTAEGTPAPGDLGTALRPLTADAVVAQAEPTAYAWRVGPLSTVVTTSDGMVRLSVTTHCQ